MYMPLTPYDTYAPPDFIGRCEICDREIPDGKAVIDDELDGLLCAECREFIKETADEYEPGEE